MTAYYNEIDPYAAQWLRNLIDAGHIARGDVDERSIADVRADDLRGYTQAHFFAGIGGWSLALRLAGWPDDRLVWTGSCPCQPLSAAGKGLGTRDERHLWPEWRKLIAECQPIRIFGEQVASADGLAWFDIVQTDLDAESYTSGAVDLCAAGVGAPHIRQRLYFVAYPSGERAGWNAGTGARSQIEGNRERGKNGVYPSDAPFACGTISGMADADARGQRVTGSSAGDRSKGSEPHPHVSGAAIELGNTECGGRASGAIASARTQASIAPGSDGARSPWRDVDWLHCSDGKARAVEPGTFPLADGIPGRVGLLRGYGNAIVPQVAAAFIRAAM